MLNILEALLFVSRFSLGYKDVMIHAFTCVLDEEEETQFTAMAIEYLSDMYYPVYHGTDGTLTGWKEDFI